MNDDEKFRKAIAPKSDQMNGDDLILGQKTIKVMKVVVGDSDQQPISIFYDGDNGKPYKPCKSMGRVLGQCWGGPQTWIGKSMTLYRDEKVTWAGMEVGGIRISHMSDISGPVIMSLSANNKSKKPFTVKPLVAEQKEPVLTADDYISDFANVTTLDGLKHKFAQAAKAFKDSTEFARIHEAKEKRKAELTAKEEPAA